MIARDLPVRQRPDEAVASLAERAADEDEPVVRVARHRRHHVHHVRHDRQREARRLQQFRELDVRRRDVEEDGLAVVQQLQRLLRDALLLRAVLRLALRDEMILVRRDSQRPAIRLLEAPVLLQQREILADAVIRHREPRTELLHAHRPMLVHELDNHILTLFWQHGDRSFSQFLYHSKMPAHVCWRSQES